MFMDEKLIKAFINEDTEVVNESVLLNSLIQKLKGLEMSFGSRMSKDDPRYQKISQGFAELEQLIAQLNS